MNPNFHSHFFTISELTFSETATRKAITNTPNKNQVIALNALCINVLDPLRESLGVPVHINSGYRSLVVNWAVGGSSTSQHLKGEAADLVVAGSELLDVARQVAKLKLPFDQMIYEGKWLHLSHAINGKQRREILKATFRPDGVSYAPMSL